MQFSIFWGCTITIHLTNNCSIKAEQPVLPKWNPSKNTGWWWHCLQQSLWCCFPGGSYTWFTAGLRIWRTACRNQLLWRLAGNWQALLRLKAVERKSTGKDKVFYDTWHDVIVQITGCGQARTVGLRDDLCYELIRAPWSVYTYCASVAGTLVNVTNFQPTAGIVGEQHFSWWMYSCPSSRRGWLMFLQAVLQSIMQCSTSIILNNDNIAVKV